MVNISAAAMINEEIIAYKHPYSVLIVFVILLLFGILSLMDIPFEIMPDIPSPELTVLCEMPFFPAGEIEQLLTIPLENALTSLEGLQSIDSLSKEGISSISLRYQWGTDMKQASMEAREYIDTVYPLLPQGVHKPLVISAHSNESPLLSIALIPENQTIHYSTIQFLVKEQIKSTDVTSRIEIKGLKKPEIHIDMDLNILKSLGTGLGQSAQSLGSFLIDRNMGNLVIDERQRLLQLKHRIYNTEDLENLSIYPGNSMLLKEFAHVSMAHEKESSLFMYGAKEAILIDIYKKWNIGTIPAGIKLKETLKRIEEAYADNFKIIIVKDSCIELTKIIRSLAISLLAGLGASLIVLYSLYQQKLIPLITASSIPLTILVSIFIFRMAHISFNSISLLGMIVGIGLIADNTIIVLEELESGQRNLKNVSSSLISSTMTTVIVFLPPLFLPGVFSYAFRELIYAISICMILSLPISHYFAPACYFIFSKQKQERTDNFYLSCLYEKSLLQVMRINKKWLFLLILIPISIFLLFYDMEKELLPKNPSRKGVLQLSLSDDMEYEAIVSYGKELSLALMKKFQIEQISIKSGYEKENKESLTVSRNMLNNLNLEIEFTDYYSPDSIAQMLLFLRMNFKIRNEQWIDEKNVFEKLFSRDEGRIVFIKDSDKDVNFIEQYNMKDLNDQSRKVLRLNLDHKVIKSVNLNTVHIHKEVHDLLNGVIAGKIFIQNEYNNIRIQAYKKFRDEKQDLLNYPIQSPSGIIALKNLGQIQEERDYYEILRKDRERVNSYLLPEAFSMNPELKKKIIEAETTDYELLVKLFCLSLLLLFSILGIQSASLIDSLILFSSLPLSIFGSLVFLRLFSMSFNMYSLMGMLILQGTIVNTGILLITSYKKSTDQNILELSVQKLRPVLGSALTSIGALIPILITSSGSDTGNFTMSLTVMSGLCIATILILYLIPYLYSQVFTHES